MDATTDERMPTLSLTVTVITCLVLTATPLSAATRLACPPAEDAHRCYTIQIQAAPAAQRAVVRETCRALQARGYVAYCQQAVVRGRTYVRLRLGAFATRTEAEACAGEFARREGCDYFVVPGDVYLDTGGEGIDIVTTPAGVWLQSPTETKRLYRFDATGRPGTWSPARVSPSGRAVAFYADDKIIKLDLTDNATSILRDDRDRQTLFNVALRWSPDGRHLAYLDQVGWELPTRLWIVRADGHAHRCLAGDDTRTTKVKSFQWYPGGNALFYVAGPTHGTVSIGGDLRCVDLSGRSRVLVPADTGGRHEVAADFQIVRNQLRYRLAHFDATGQMERYTEDALSIDAEAPP